MVGNRVPFPIQSEELRKSVIAALREAESDAALVVRIVKGDQQATRRMIRIQQAIKVAIDAIRD